MLLSQEIYCPITHPHAEGDTLRYNSLAVGFLFRCPWDESLEDKVEQKGGSGHQSDVPDGGKKLSKRVYFDLLAPVHKSFFLGLHLMAV